MPDEFPDPEAIGHVLGIGAARGRMGHSVLWQHEATAQQEFAPGSKAIGMTARPHQRLSAANRSHALYCRAIIQSYHEYRPHW
jgi:hypothetical protein